MSVKNVTPDDVALIELARDGKTGAPSAVLERLRARGRITVAAGVPSLTPKGRRRGQALLPMEHDLRLMFKSSDDAPIKTVAGSTFHVGGGRARIYS